MKEKRPLRNEIENKYKWDLSKLYASSEAWYEDLAKIEPLVNELVSYKGHIMDSSDNLLKLLSAEELLNRLINKLYVYAAMYNDQDGNNNESKTLKGKIENVLTDINKKTFFIAIEILKSDYSLVEKYLMEQEPLNKYQHAMKKLFRAKAHVLSDAEELILTGVNELMQAPDNTYDALMDTDLSYGTVMIGEKEVEVTRGNYTKLLKNKDQNVRKNVFEAMYNKLNQFRNTFSSTYKYNVKGLAFISETRKYDNPLQMSLYQGDIDPIVYDNLIKVVNDGLPILHRYIELKKKEIGVKDFHMYDIYVETTDSDGKEYPYEEAFDLVKEGLSLLGEDYVQILDKAYQEHWLDVYDNVGKRSGAYSSGCYDSYPYILLNHNGTLDSVFTIAHELGHSVNTYLTNQTQAYIYSDHSIFTAEVASTVNELLLSKYLINKLEDKHAKKIILNELMEKFKSTIYRQTMFAEFEKIMFEKEVKKEVLTEEVISEIYYNLNKKYYGNNIIHDDLIKLEWAYIPHFYRPFYVYQYATGLSAACAIVTNILSKKPGALENYKKFLASGSSDYPINLLKIAGIDMSSPEPIKAALSMFEETLNEYINL